MRIFKTLPVDVQYSMKELPSKRFTRNLSQEERTEMYWLVVYGKFTKKKVGYYYGVSADVVSNMIRRGNLENKPSKQHFDESFTGRLQNCS